ncbi:MAG: hypothetical protein M1423_00185, partial [Acidobacteria bacterium]|nr:hypothetical protein [Acidobacteriota bacterium]
MSVSTLPKQTPALIKKVEESRRGLTFRSFVICIFALLLMGMWNEYHTCFLGAGGDALLENSPPNGAITTLIIVLCIAALLYRFRRSFGLITAELVVIYAALLIAAPLMTQGLWHRLFGLIAALPHTQDFKSYESLPPMLWPHGDNLVVNGRFVEGLDGFTVTGTPGDYSHEMVNLVVNDQFVKSTAGPTPAVAGTTHFQQYAYRDGQQVVKTGPTDKVMPITWKGARWSIPQLTNADKDTARSQLEFTIPRYRTVGGKQIENLVPGESYLFSCLVHAAGFQSSSYYFVRMSVDGGPMRTVLLDAGMTTKTFANPTGLKRVGKCPVIIPGELQKNLTLAIGLAGPGQLAIHDIQFFNSEGVEAAFTGVNVTRQRNLRPKIIGKDGKEEDNPDYLPPNERENLVVKPDNMFSLAGLGYLLEGFIPLQQWVTPMFAWSLLIGALFMGFFGVNVLLRKQWVESERFTYP